MTPAEYENEIDRMGQEIQRQAREVQRYRNTLTTIREFLPNGATASQYIDAALAAPSTLGIQLLEVE